MHGIYNHVINWQAFIRCAMCAGTHLSKDCTTITEHTPNPVYKCFNCAVNNIDHNHKATNPLCPFRAKYSATTLSVREKNKRKPKQHSINNTNTHNNASCFVPAPPPRPLTSSFAHTAAGQTNGQHITHSNVFTSPSYTNSVSQSIGTHSQPNAQPNIQPNIQTNSSKLFSFAEVTKLLMDSIHELNQCKSKMDQIGVIAKLLRYACE